MILTAHRCEDFFLNPLFTMLVFAGYNPLNFIRPENNQSIRTVFYINTTFSTRNKAQEH
jgi:hypothetical protein